MLLLALFSSPTNFKSGRPIPQLQLMKEIMSCIEAIRGSCARYDRPHDLTTYSPS